MNQITVTGKINFNPINLTKKHNTQGEWKSNALIDITDYDICKYYQWFIKKRHGLELVNPQRGSHITFVSDRKSEISNWESVSKKYHGTRIKLKLNLDARTDGSIWWLTVVDKTELQNIRNELGLGLPFFGLHMTIGNVRERQTEHGHYIHTLYKKNYAH